jgi:hypothetical protein
MDSSALGYKKEKDVYECAARPFSKADRNGSDWTFQVRADKGYQKASGYLYEQKTPEDLKLAHDSPSTSATTECKYTCNGVNSAPLHYNSDAFLFVYAVITRRHTDVEFKTFKIMKY